MMCINEINSLFKEIDNLENTIKTFYVKSCVYEPSILILTNDLCKKFSKIRSKIDDKIILPEDIIKKFEHYNILLNSLEEINYQLKEDFLGKIYSDYIDLNKYDVIYYK